jgi:hypothetical protein
VERCGGRSGLGVARAPAAGAAAAGQADRLGSEATCPMWHFQGVASGQIRK